MIHRAPELIGETMNAATFALFVVVPVPPVIVVPAEMVYGFVRMEV